MSKAKTSLLRLKNILEKERELLLKFPLGEPKEFLELQEEKREVLSKLSHFEEKDFKDLKELVKEVKELNEEVRALLTNNYSFIRELLEELFPKTTYTGKEGSSAFNFKA